MRPYGRRAFVAVTLGGLSSLLSAKRAWRFASGALSPAADVLPSAVRKVVPSGWRIYTVAATMPTFDAESWRLRIDGLVEHALELTHDDLLALPRGPSRSRTSTA